MNDNNQADPSREGSTCMLSGEITSTLRRKRRCEVRWRFGEDWDSWEGVMNRRAVAWAFEARGVSVRRRGVPGAVKDLTPEGVSYGIEKLVEPMGFEPTTSSMPSRRAPSCATAPPKLLL